MKVFIKTYGCQMNVRDSEALAGMLTRSGAELTASEADADVMIFNTCSVRDQAERKAIGKITFMKKYKKLNPELIIGVIGCMAQNRGQELLDKISHLDFALGTGQLHRLTEVVEKIRRHRQQIALLEDSSEVLDAMGMHSNWQNSRPHTGMIAITRGCNRFCSYCIVPYVRGREISRKLSDIVDEAKMLAEQGVREVMLLGQNVAAYGCNGNINPPPANESPFGELLQEIARIDGIKRIRYTSPYPTFFTDKLIDIIASEPKICRNVHLPMQSGSDRILRSMNRQYTAASYLEIVNKLKNAIGEVTFSTDVIVGFPGETDEDFICTKNLMNEVGFDHAFIFKYSPRSGAKSAEWIDDVPQEVKEERNQILLKDLERRSIAGNLSCVGRTLEVMVDGVSPRNPERWSGRTSTARTVVFKYADGMKPGDLINVPIDRAGRVTLFGPGLVGADEEL
ncbi:MAG: tRNA (N6-isopentenyl adenosine(37)-C2)-methylthiotransferase MiaB [Lentisphaerae bacterium]|nr:tRNA (N6-isopentenyl adenosine(37)-C2)-methylthiotransferase MiaB [Lentisphaerota bacterium]